MLEKMVLIFTVWLHICGALFAHPMYLSVTNMDIDAQRGSIVLNVRIFADDLETILHNKYNVDGWIGTPNEHRESRRLLREYVNERFSVTVNNGEKIVLVTDSIIFSREEEGAVMWFHMSGVTHRPIRRIEVENRLLTDFFSSQKNVVMLSTGRSYSEKGYVLNRRNFKFELSL
jgi:hypothetical protein